MTGEEDKPQVTKRQWRQPTMQEINSACFAFRSDYGVMAPEDQMGLQADASAWFLAWQKSLQLHERFREVSNG